MKARIFTITNAVSSAVLFLFTAVLPMEAQTNFVLHTFGHYGLSGGLLGVYTNADGINPNGWLTLSGAGMYGTAVNGGTNGSGTLFLLKTNPAFNLLYTFPKDTVGLSNTYGANPNGGLVLSGTNLFGTAYNGGIADNGTLFSISTNGTGIKNLHNFPAFDLITGTTNKDGANPSAGLLLSGATLYGTAQFGGTYGNGVVFAYNTTNSTFTVLHSFAAENSDAYGNFTNSDGANPTCKLLLSGIRLYGTTSNGGTNGLGTVFAVNTNGTGFAVLHHFDNDGANPNAGVVMSGGTLFGIGGSIVYALNTNGTGFAILQQFGDLVDNASFADSGLTVSNSVLYGSIASGGAYGYGQVFSMNTNGTGFTAYHDFTTPVTAPPPATNSDGINPGGGLVVLNGSLYGAASGGGAYGSGVLFMAPPPPTSPSPLSGQLNGNNLILSFQTYSGLSYLIQQNSNLATTNWISITGITGNGSLLQYTVPIRNLKQLFFRAILSDGTALPPPSFPLSSRLSSGGLLLDFQTLAGLSYTIQSTTNLAVPNWVDFTNFIGDGAVTELLLPTTNIPQLFLRVRQP